ncbi:MAG: PEP-CTERM sorting domain-containing protein [Deltaproteobacteria bacterium]|nr:PEP-CTERM sorting domain-containing protein [Deltaproteobacteria bacterium]
MKRTRRKLLQIALCTFFALAMAPGAESATLSFELDHEFSGATPPEGDPPWVRAVFEDHSPGSVLLTLDNFNLTAGEFITEWYFNFESSAELLQIDLVQALNANKQDITTLFADHTLEGIELGQDDYKADGDGIYDILFHFAKNSNLEESSYDGRFGAQTQALFQITGDGITAASFNELSAPGGGNGPFATAAHVQGIGADNDYSGWIAPSGGGNLVTTTPEPGTFVLLGAGLLFLGGWVRKRSFAGRP